MITRAFREENGHRVFEAAANDADYRACGFAELFENEEKYWWFIARKEFIKKYMQRHIETDAKIMEVGAGTGNVTRFLLKNGYKNISVGEMHLSALDYAKGYGIAERNCFNLLDCPFVREFDCICAFDVLEHIEDDFGALKNIHRALKGGEGGGDSALGGSMAGDSAADSPCEDSPGDLGRRDSSAVDSGATGATGAITTGGGQLNNSLHRDSPRHNAKFQDSPRRDSRDSQDSRIQSASTVAPAAHAGKLILTVPAFQWLWNAHDVDVGHKRRYTKKSLTTLLESAGFEVLEAKYFFVSITPLLFLRSLLNPAKPDQVAKGDTIQKVNPLVNAALLAISRVDNALIPHLPNVFGGSLLIVARKKS